MNVSEYRRMARQVLRGRWGLIFPIMFAMQAVAYAFGLDTIWTLFFSKTQTVQLTSDMVYSFYVPVGFGVLLAGLSYAVQLFYLLTRIGSYRAADTFAQGERPALRQLFPMRTFWKMLVMNLVRSLLVALQLLLLVVPGIIAIFRYSMADYLLAENPELGPIESLRESSERMKGHKAALFTLELSFIGWMLLNLLALSLLDAALPTGVISSLLYVVLACMVDAPLSAYILLGELYFFKDISAAPVETILTDAPQATPEQPAPEPEPEADEAAARELFFRYGCSRSRLRANGLLEEYEKLGGSLSSEAAWVRECGDQLMRRFDRDPEALDDLLRLSAEYAIPELIDRALQRIDRHIRQETLPPAQVLNMAGRALSTLTSGAFDTSGGFLGRKHDQIAGMADRLEERLVREDPDGEWRQTLEWIRGMCAKA